jgi:hypothetical protein
VVLGLALSLPLDWSYSRAMTAPGGGSAGLRTVEWVRSVGGGDLVGWTENWWYRHHPPPVGGVPAAGLVPAGRALLTPEAMRLAVLGALALPPPVAVVASSAMAGEGRWSPAGQLVRGVPAVYTTWVRPDPVHTSLVTGVAWMDTGLLHTELFSGTVEPGGSGWRNTSPIALDRRSQLVAAFNSGFRLTDSRGGYFAEGRVARPLVAGAASLVLYGHGRPAIGAWGRQVRMGPDVVAVRQNLSLILDGGAPVPGLNRGSSTWGATVANKVFVWRSGLGITASGALVYVGGKGLSVNTLADVLRRAGAVRAMELDINTHFVNYFTYTAPSPTDADGITGSKLVNDMTHDPSRYFRKDQRDFIALFAG